MRMEDSKACMHDRQSGVQGEPEGLRAPYPPTQALEEACARPAVLNPRLVSQAGCTESHGIGGHARMYHPAAAHEDLKQPALLPFFTCSGWDGSPALVSHAREEGGKGVARSERISQLRASHGAGFRVVGGWDG